MKPSVYHARRMVLKFKANQEKEYVYFVIKLVKLVQVQKFKI